MTVTCALKINDRGPDRRILLTGPDGQSLVAPAGEYRVAFEPASGTLAFADGEVQFQMPRAVAEHYRTLHLISGRIPNDNVSAETTAS